MTSLSTQLQKLQTRPTDTKKLADSFLFNKSDARSFSRQQIWQLATDGLQTLVSMDNSFHPFIAVLFDIETSKKERKLMMTDEVRVLDAHLEHFLTLLSPHLFLTAAQQVFEYLVRVYEVHVYNVSAVLRAFLPYHEHNLFARALLLLDLRDTGLEFLAKNQERGAPLLQDHLVLACGESREVLRLVCATATMPFQFGITNHAANALFAAVATRLATHVEADAKWRVLLPVLVEFMSGSVRGELASPLGLTTTRKEAACTALVVLAAWCTEVQFSLQTVAAVIKPMFSFLEQALSSTAAVAPLPDLLAVLEVLFRTQRAVVDQVQFAAQLHTLISLPWSHWTPLLRTTMEMMLAKGVVPYEALLSTLVDFSLDRVKVAHSVTSVSADVLAFLECAATELPLSPRIVGRYLETLMTCEDTFTGGEKQKKQNKSDEATPFFESVVAALERRYQTVFDQTLSSLLHSQTGRSSVTSFLSRHLSGTRYQMVELKKASGEQLPLFACLLHPTPEVRQLGASTLRDMKMEQLLHSTGGGQGSLADLFAHVLSYEGHVATAKAFVTTAAFLLRGLVAEDSRAPSAGGMPPQALARLLLQSLHQLASLHGTEFTALVLDQVVEPLLQETAPTTTSAAKRGGRGGQKGKGKKGGAKRSNANEEEEGEGEEDKDDLYTTTLYYALLLYTSVAAATASSKSAGPLPAVEKLNKTLEQQFENLPRAAQLLQLSLESGAPQKGATKGAKPHSDDSDDEDDKAKEANDKKKTANATKEKEGTKNTYIDVLQSARLLSCVKAEAAARLQGALSEVTAVLADSKASPQQYQRASCECLLSSAATLRENTAETVRVLHRFLLGEKGQLEVLTAEEGGATAAASAKQGYLSILLHKQRGALQSQLHQQEHKSQVGRGATNDGISSLYIPQDSLTRHLGQVVRAAVVELLAAEAAAPTQSSAAVFTWLPASLRLLAYLHTPLPSLLVHPQLLPPAFFQLLAAGAEESTAALVPWHTLLQTAVYGESNEVAAAAAAGAGAGAGLGALALILFFPLYMAQDKRERLLQSVQSLILEAMSAKGKKKSEGETAAGTLLAGVLSAKQDPISVTTLSAVVEAMARAESRYQLTTAAAELVSRMVGEKVGADGSDVYVLPAEVAARVVEEFFAAPSLDGTPAAKSGAQLTLRLVLPRVRHIIVRGSASAAQADLVTTVCRRSVVQPATQPTEDPALELCALLLKHSHLQVTGASATRPVYRHALTLLAHTLQKGTKIQEISSASTLIFSTRKAVATKEKAGDLSETYVAAIAAHVAPLIVEAVRRIGPDVAQFCVGTMGGYHRIVRPYLLQSEHAEANMDVLTELLLEMAPRNVSGDATTTTAATDAAARSSWQAPAACALSHPLQYEDAVQLLHLGLPSKSKSNTAHKWTATAGSARRLQLLAALLRASPAVHYDDDEEAEAEQSLYHLVQQLLQLYPLEGTLALLSRSEEEEEADETIASAGGQALAVMEGGQRLLGVFPRLVLDLLRCLVDVCLHQTQALSEKVSGGALAVRGLILKQGLVLMASLLLQQGDDQSKGAKGKRNANEEEEEEEAAAGDVALSGKQKDHLKEKIDTIAELLRVLAPLLANARGNDLHHSHAHAADSDTLQQKDFYLHIPLVALLIRLEPYERTATLRYKTAAEVSQEILTSFDIHTQIQCISQLMQLVCDPAAQLAYTEEGTTEADDNKDMVFLFRRLVKTNQVLNRQEEILNLINTTVKSESFLGPFIELQHKGNRGVGHKKTDSDAAAATAEGAEENEQTVAAMTADGNQTDSVCMGLIVSALSFFSHFSELNEQTENDTTSAEVQFGEQKSYAMLLELLAGNALACVLAGINEPTFVSCQLQLLANSRAAVQLKGLEVLVDRLHHSLPTVENTMSDAELEQHRRDLRDPKKKLTLMDLVRVKARPLTTKRTFALYTPLSRLCTLSLRTALAAIQKGLTSAAADLPLPMLLQLLYMAQLCTVAMEELVRIVGSGGSTQAEKTLLNVNRSKRVSESTLSKLFGNKSRVQEVHDMLDDVCGNKLLAIMSTLQRVVQADTAAASTELNVNKVAASIQDGDSRRQLEEGLLATQATLMTSLGTVAQVMGAAFISQHCIALLESVVRAAVYEVVELPPLVTQGEGGSLVRHTTLSTFIRCFPSCWHMSQPYLSRVIFSATHLTNVNDAETHYLCAEVLTVLEALLEPQLFVDACAECLRGTRYVPSHAAEGSKGHTIRLQVLTHSFDVFFGCVGRRVQNLKKEELMHMSVMTEGTTPQQNFWLAALQTLAAAPVIPPSEVVTPVMEAYAIFFLKFKPKHCVKLLRVVAEWAFGGDSEKFSRQMAAGEDSDADEAGPRGRAESGAAGRQVVHRWIVFFALYNFLLNKLEAILEFAFAVVTPYIVPVLANHCSSTGGSKPLGSLLALALEGALDSVRRMALAHTPGPDADPSIPVDVYLAVPEVFNSMMPALVHQIHNTSYLTDDTHDYTFRARQAVLPTLRAFFACLNSNKLQSKTQAELIRDLRHPHSEVRRMTVLCLDGFYADGGEELAARLMAEMLPSVVELTEDRDEAVVEATREFCTNLSHMTGQDVLYAMSS